MYEHLFNFLNKNKMLYDHLFGFQKKKSTSMAILDIYSKLIDSIEQKKFSCSVFLDFGKGFDTQLITIFSYKNWNIMEFEG